MVCENLKWLFCIGLYFFYNYFHFSTGNLYCIQLWEVPEYIHAGYLWHFLHCHDCEWHILNVCADVVFWYKSSCSYKNSNIVAYLIASHYFGHGLVLHLTSFAATSSIDNELGTPL